MSQQIPQFRISLKWHPQIRTIQFSKSIHRDTGCTRYKLKESYPFFRIHH